MVEDNKKPDFEDDSVSAVVLVPGFILLGIVVLSAFFPGRETEGASPWILLAGGVITSILITVSIIRSKKNPKR